MTIYKNLSGLHNVHAYFYLYVYLCPCFTFLLEIICFSIVA